MIKLKKYIFLFFSIILFSLIMLINIDYFNKNTEVINEETIIKEDIKIEENIPEVISNNYINNQVGYIKINDTNIDAKVMQYTDNDYYLTHDENGNYSIFGSIYMDYRNSFDDQKILIFGHNTNGNSISPLHDLENYESFSFYQEHPYIMIELNGQTHKWHVFSVLVVSNKSNKHMKLKFTIFRFKNF